VSDVLPPRLPLDEDLSPVVAQLLSNSGIDATHVRNRARLGTSDKEVLELAFNEDRILVTANVRDFANLASSTDLHRGIILIEEGSLIREEQLRLLKHALQHLRAHNHDLINHVLRISLNKAPAIEPMPK